MSMRNTRSLGLGALALLTALTLSGGKASAGSIWVIPDNTSNDDQAIDGRATFTFGDNSLEIFIENLIVNPTSSSQSISGINFEIDGSPTGMNFVSGTGTIIEIFSGGSYSPTGATSTTRWDLNSNNGIWTLTGGQPDELIVGAPGANNTYNNANNSIKNRNPHLFKEATFLINFGSGVSSSSMVSNVVFLYGTDGDPITAVVPEPSTIAMTCLGLLAPLGVAGVRRWRRRALVELA